MNKKLLKRKSYIPFSIETIFPSNQSLEEPDVMRIANTYFFTYETDIIDMTQIGCDSKTNLRHMENKEITEYKIEKKYRNVSGPFSSEQEAKDFIKSSVENLTIALFGRRNFNAVNTEEGFVVFYDVYHIRIAGKTYNGEVFVEE